MRLGRGTARVPRTDSSLRTCWLGAISFEERCIGSLSRLADDFNLAAAVGLDYSTEIQPVAEAEARRAAHGEELRQRALRLGAGFQKWSIDAYSFYDLEQAVTSAATESEQLIVDVSCLTKVHTMALAAALARVEVKWRVAYTMPENYGSILGEGTFGWRDTVIAPLSETGTLFHEEMSRGIVIPGHEADRLRVALAEIEPAGGVILVADALGRPDLRHLSERRNQRTINYLLRMRSAEWRRMVVDTRNATAVASLVEAEVAKARPGEAHSPVVLFPYGPKPVVFAASLELATTYAEAAWFVYPVPIRYDAFYSEGTSSTIWYLPQSSREPIERVASANPAVSE